MLQVNIHEAKTQISKLVDRASRGEEVIIANAGIPAVRLTPCEPMVSGRRFGVMRGRAQLDDRLFEPFPEGELAAWE